MDDSNLQRLAAGLHALDCTRCHRGAYCGGINDDDLGRAELLMDDVVTDLLAEADLDRLRHEIAVLAQTWGHEPHCDTRYGTCCETGQLETLLRDGGE